MRGKHWQFVERVVAAGITPAHAGKTLLRMERPPCPPDHPRACGENAWPKPRYSEPSGSPPRMRGKPSPGAHRAHPGGITPAHAGKTSARRTSRRSIRDHPRACGENGTLSTMPGAIAGSPPRMRGKPGELGYSLDIDGITPAHAGKTMRFMQQWCATGDHPRACGENVNVLSEKLPRKGSPPRMRGKPSTRFSGALPAGITPAHAGKTRGKPTEGC